jgi:hypothetical protein
METLASAVTSEGCSRREHPSGGRFIIPNENNELTVTDFGLTRKQVHEACAFRDAERKQPGIVSQTIDGADFDREFP